MIKKKISILLILTVVLAVLLSACGGSQPSSGKKDTDKSVEETKKEEKEDKEEEKEKKEDSEKDGEEKKEGKQDDKSGEEADTSKDAAETKAETAEEGNALGYVENNGSCFVGLGDKVYFRWRTTDSLPETVLWGKFIDAPADEPKGDSYICSFDRNTHEVKKLFPDDGFGDLYYGDGGFFSTHIVDNNSEAYWVSLDGKDKRILGPGDVVGSYPFADGSIAIVSEYREFHSLVEYTIDGEIARVVGEGNKYLEFCGITRDFFVVLRHDYDADTETLFQVLLIDNQLVELGDIPESEYEFADSRVDDFYWAPDQEESAEAARENSEGTIYVMLGYYEGSANMLSGRKVFSARAYTEQSLQVEADINETNEPDKVGKISLDDSGNISVVSHEENSAALSEAGSGDLVYYGEDGEKTVLVKDYIKQDPYGVSEKGDPVTFLQTADVFPEGVFVIIADCAYAPEDDIGWRAAYSVNDMRYQFIPVFDEFGMVAKEGEFQPEELAMPE